MTMLKPYSMTIVRTIKTVITVDGENANDAHAKITAYGLIEAINDFPVRDESVSAKISHVAPIRRGE